MLSRIRRAAHRSDDGFTLPEVVASIVIIGLIMTPLCSALMQSMNLIPKGAATAKFAADNDLALLKWSDDVSGAQIYVNQVTTQLYWRGAVVPTSPSSADVPCPTPPSSPTQQNLLALIAYDNAAGGSNTGYNWRLQFSAVTGVANRVFVELQRLDVTWKTQTRAYCTTGDAVATMRDTPPLKRSVVSPTGIYDGEITLTLRLRTINGDPYAAVILRANLRPTGY